MASYVEWTKGLQNKREVVVIASSLKIDRHEAAGRVMAFWDWCDDNVPEEAIDKVNGDAVIVLSPVRGDTEKFIDEVVALKGFSRSMEKVGWIVHRKGSIVLPNYGRHNGSTAKSRNRNTKNQQKRRANTVTILSPESSDKNATNITEHTLVSSLEEILQNGSSKSFEFELSCLRRIQSPQLRDMKAICTVHRAAHRELPGRIGRDIPSLGRFVIAADSAMASGKRPAALFRWIIQNPSQFKLDADDIARAEIRIKEHRSWIEQQRSAGAEVPTEITPLPDDRT